MGSIVFAAPGVDQFHLHERLRRELQQHGHSVDVLSLDPAAHTFWRHQGGATTLLEPRSPDAMRAPLGDLADRECTRRGLGGESSARRRHRSAIEQRLARLLPTLATWIEAHRPGLVLLHEQRSAEHALVHWAARELGCRVLWTGDGLLPHTLQADERGLDGDAAASQRRPGDYRVVDGDPALLQACLSNVLARTIPAALTRREVVVPTLWARLGCVWAATAARGAGGARSALFGWRRALPLRSSAPRAPLQLPHAPFVTVLLQDDGQARVTLDAVAPPTAGELIRASIAAAARL
ncbi:MAG TPA: hypothetical protein VFZ65_20360, partial [Planctomycetota bacterium]|nr:hypothetical protein [Planctomycetota bacterium]